MKLNIFFISLFSVFTLADMFVPIAAEGRTVFSYWVFVVAVLGRIIFFFKLYGLPINWKVAASMESAAYLLTMIFMFSAKYKKSFPLNTLGFLFILLFELIILAIYAFEEYTFVYIEKEYKEERNNEIDD